MRKILAATILFVPTLLSAQALHSGMSHLVASVDAPAFGFQASAISAVKPHVFTGLIAPVRLTAIELAPSAASPAVTEVMVEFTVDTAGVPQDIHVKRAPTQAISNNVVTAIQNVRYTPGKLDGQAIAMPVTLRLNIAQ